MSLRYSQQLPILTLGSPRGCDLVVPPEAGVWPETKAITPVSPLVFPGSPPSLFQGRLRALKAPILTSLPDLAITKHGKSGYMYLVKYFFNMLAPLPKDTHDI